MSDVTESKVTESNIPTRQEAPGAELPTVLALFNEQQRVVDTVIGMAKERGWCSDATAALSLVYPEGSQWSDGVWRNTAGHDMFGYDVEGYHFESGYNRDGINRAGGKSPDNWCHQCNQYH